MKEKLTHKYIFLVLVIIFAADCKKDIVDPKPNQNQIDYKQEMREFVQKRRLQDGFGRRPRVGGDTRQQPAAEHINE